MALKASEGAQEALKGLADAEASLGFKGTCVLWYSPVGIGEAWVLYFWASEIQGLEFFLVFWRLQRFHVVALCLVLEQLFALWAECLLSWGRAPPSEEHIPCAQYIEAGIPLDPLKP